MNLMLSGDAKPRLKWSQELHERFVDAVNQLGGANRATPKSVMKVMGVNGLTLYHLKSHLQKYRTGKNEQSQSYHEDSEQESRFTGKSCNEEKNQINESLQIAKALQAQMEVQRKLHEQIEVQRHLQLRIEAQGKYLQSVLEKAHEAIDPYSSRSTEEARFQLSQLVALFDTGYPNPSSSVLTESEGLFTEDAKKIVPRHAGSSRESSLTSAESSGRDEEARPICQDKEQNKVSETSTSTRKRNFEVLSLMDMNPAQKRESASRVSDLKSNSVNPSHEDHEQTIKFGLSETFELNGKYCMTEIGSGRKTIDLNCNAVEQFTANL